MLIPWQTINAVRRPQSSKFTRGSLVITPGITIKNRRLFITCALSLTARQSLTQNAKRYSLANNICFIERNTLNPAIDRQGPNI